MAFNGSQGRIEHHCEETVYVSGDGTVPGELLSEGTTIKVIPHFGTAYMVPVWSAEGGHGGGDDIMLAELFGHPEERLPDPYLRAADQRGGAYSILTGVAANISIATGNAVQIDDLVRDIGWPDYPNMPGRDDPIALSEKPAGRRLSAEQVRAIGDESDQT